MDGYSREKFPHWIDQGDSCNTREVVLKRDGTGVQVGSDCYPTAGRWYSVYDATWVSDPGDVQIDHVVPLADAWRSGADQWTTSRRQDYANDLRDPQLIAVSGSSNEDKSDQDDRCGGKSPGPPPGKARRPRPSPLGSGSPPTAATGARTRRTGSTSSTCGA